MKGIDSATAAPGNLFTAGDPTTGTQATAFTPDWCNDVQNEMLNIITSAGQTPQKGVMQLLKSMLILNNPVGTLMWTQDLSFNPNTHFGFGTWSKICVGRYPVLYESGDPDFGTVGQQGGSKTITLDTTQLPAHTHAVAQHTHSIANHTHTISATHSHTTPGHTHTIAQHNHNNGVADDITGDFVYGSTTADMPGSATVTVTDETGNPKTYQGLTSTGGPTVTGTGGASNTGTSSPGSTDAGGTANTGSGGPTATGSTGTGDSVSILPRYEVVGVCWARTA